MTENTGRQQERMEVVYGAIDEARHLWHTVRILDGCLRALMFLLAAVLVGFVADNLLALPGTVRLIYGGALVAGLIYMLARYVVGPLLQPMTDEMVAAHIERSYPELDNHLINSVLLSKEKIKDTISLKMARSQINETAAYLAKSELDRSTNPALLWRWGKWALILLVALAAYVMVFSDYFSNAFKRFAQPYKYIPPITDTRLSVSPGDAERLQGESLVVEAYTEGVLPEKALLYSFDEESGPTCAPMVFEGNCFIYEFSNLQNDFRYWVQAGDAKSRRYQVTVKTRPAIDRIRITYNYPAYTGTKPKSEVTQTGNIDALIGTTVRLDITADRPLKRGRIEIEYLVPAKAPDASDRQTIVLSRQGTDVLSGEFALERSGQYRILVEDRAGVENDPQLRQIVARPDEPPVVKFLEPAKSVAVPPDARVTLLAEAKDDFTLKGLSLMLQRKAGQDWTQFRTWSYDGGERRASEGCVLELKGLDLAIGDTLMYYMQASDGRQRADEQAGRSRTYQVSIIDPSLAEKQQERQLEVLRRVIERLISLQKANLNGTLQVAEWDQTKEGDIEADAEVLAHYRSRTAQLVKGQEGIYTLASDTVRSHSGTSASDLVEMLGRIAAGEMIQAVDELQKLSALRGNSAIAPTAQTAAATEQKIVSLLERLLENPRALLAERLEKEGKKEKLSGALEDMASNRERAEKMLESIRQFKEDQKEVIELTSQLKEKPVDEFTEGDERTLDKIIETEEKWAEYFQEAATDLSKLPPQDFSLANQAKEHLEIYSEIQQAIGAAEKKAIELAVPLEQGGLELAESIETNIEKWLMEEPDKLKWSMEDPTQDFDVPLAELPDELEDIIGDLMESEEDMTEDVEDVTSAWLDSLDKGAGWGTMDGPISNMSAKGVTGNTMPNKQEVGGRSGEGRTAKSSGQFVEETATGKGGRRTPTRLTPDAFEAGSVKDTSAEPPTGSTGGGKLSGWGAEGLQGPPPPPIQQKLKRLANQQQQLIDQARHLDFGLKKYRYPRGELPSTIKIMEELQGHLARAELGNFAAKHSIVLTNLREVKELVDKQKTVWRDRSRLLPKEVRDEIAASMDEGVPRQYRDLVNSYFRALAESGSK